MTRLDQEQEVIDLANKLGLDGEPVAAVIRYCQTRIDEWIEDATDIETIDDLEAAVAERLNLSFDEIFDDGDLNSLIDKYVDAGEAVFRTLPLDLTFDTYGTLIRLKDGTYVAVIDCRGEKASRRFFTKWHEIAHLLVEDEDFDKQVFRSNDEPLERLMDQIAGHVGFYETLFTPLFERHFAHGDVLTFEAVEQIRQSFCPYASFQSTLCACHRRVRTPMLYLEATMRYREGERRALQQRFLFDDDRPQPKLRASLIVPNNAAVKSGLTVRWNMQIPDCSVIYKLFQHGLTEMSGDENLGDWTFSTGGGLESCRVFVQARSIGKTVMATIQPQNGGSTIGRR